MMQRKVLVFSLLILCFLSSDIVLKKCHTIWLTLPSTGTKCISEKIQNNVVILADYVVVSDDPSQFTPTITVKHAYEYIIRVVNLSIDKSKR
ncbi:transmembrane emp24 domain-containing protein p24delta3-like [Fagus crenata]